MLIRNQSGNVLQLKCDQVFWIHDYRGGISAKIYDNNYVVLESNDKDLIMLILDRIFELMKNGIQTFNFYEGPLSIDAREFEFNEAEVGISGIMKGALEIMSEE